MHFRSCKDLGVLNAVGGEYGGRMAKVKIFMELDGIFHEINQPFWIPPFMETPIYEEQPMFRDVPGTLIGRCRKSSYFSHVSKSGCDEILDRSCDQDGDHGEIATKLIPNLSNIFRSVFRHVSPSGWLDLPMLAAFWTCQ